MKSTLLIAAALAVAASTTSGADESRASVHSAAAVAPFVTADTFLVIRGDVSKLDVRATFAKADEFARRMIKDDYDEDGQRALANARRRTRKWVKAFARAGGREIYMLMGLSTMRSGPYLVVPETDSANIEAIANLLTIGQTQPTENANSDGPFKTHRRIRGALVVGSEETLEHVQKTEPVERPELAKAFEATQGAAVQAVVILPPPMKAELLKIASRPPPELGADTVELIARGFSWASIGVNGPPNTSLQLVIRATDSAAAQAIGDAVPKLFRWIEKKNPLLVPQRPDQRHPLSFFRPGVSGNKLTVTLSAKQIDKLLYEHSAPMVANITAMQKEVESQTNIRVIVRAIGQYAEDRNDQWPKRLETLVKAGYIKRDILRNPNDPSRRIGYGYVRPAAMPTGDRLVIYELRQDWTRSVGAGFADGHVERMAHRPTFNKLLAEARRHAAKE